MNKNKFYLFVSIILILLAIGLGFYIPAGLKDIENNWQNYRKEKRSKNIELIGAIINSKINSFNSDAGKIKKGILSLGEKALSSEVNLLPEYINYRFFRSESLIGWRDFTPIDAKVSSKFQSGEAFFFSTDTKAFLCRVDTITNGDISYVLQSELLVEKFYKFDNKYFEMISLSNEISDAIGIDCSVNYNRDAPESKDVFRTYIELKNSHSVKIGSISFPVTSLTVEKKNFIQRINTIQAFLFTLAVAIFLIGLNLEIKNIGKGKRLAVRLLSIIAIRILLEYFDIPAKLNIPELNNPKYFSSMFAWGIAKTPVELFVTVVLFLFAVVLVFQYINDISVGKRLIKSKPVYGYLFSVFILVADLLLIRAFAASVRSFIFDSGVRYFNLNALFPKIPVALNLVNLLILGFALFLLGFSTLKIFYRFFYPLKKNIIKIIVLTIISSAIYFILDRSNLIPAAFHVGVLILLLLLTASQITGKIKSGTSVIYLALSASVFSIVTLNFFNNELSRYSLRIASDEIINGKQNLYNFWLNQLMMDKGIDRLANMPSEINKDLDSRAFLIWNRSPFMKEDIPCWVGIYDSAYDILGGYEYLTSDRIPLNLNLPDSVGSYKIFKGGNGKTNFYEGVKKIISINGGYRYLLFGIEYGSLSYTSTIEPKFVSPIKYFDKLSVNQNEYFIIKASQDKIVDNVGAVSFSFSEVNNIFDKHLNENHYNWIDLNIDSEEYLVYLFKGKNYSSLIGLKQKDLTNVLFHFFKILFMHSLIIFGLLLIFVIIKSVKSQRVVLNFRTRLFFAFFIVALIPILFLAFYLRDLTENKNQSLIRYKLKKRAVRVEKYLTNNYPSANYGFDEYEKAQNDLGIRFNIFDDKELEYSSFGKYYTTGILPELINCNSYININIHGGLNHLAKNKLDKLKYDSFYHKFNRTGLVIEINNAYNSILLPIAIDEFDTILFGSYAIASILIIILSTVLSNQISKPIQQLTRATKSISEGDFDLNLKNEYSGEMAQLVSAFNYMTKQLKKSTKDLANLEREIAWKEMAKQVAHEIKNPLTPMKLSVQHLKAAYQDKSEKFDEIFKKVTDTLINQVETLKKISTEFSSLAKMPRLNVERINLIEIIEQAVNLFADEKTEFITSFSESGVFIEADSDNLKRTLINLIRNSIQAEAGKIEIEVNNSRDVVQLILTDNGLGVPEEIKNKIFDINFSTKKEGMGLGLTLAKRFLENTGADIELADSTGKGASFIITFNRAKSA